MQSLPRRLALVGMVVALAACQGDDPAAPGDPTPVAVPSDGVADPAAPPLGGPTATTAPGTAPGSDSPAPAAPPSPGAPPPGTATPGDTAAPGGTAPAAPAPIPPPEPGASPAPPPAPPVADPAVPVVGQVADPAGDAGLEAPANADLTAITIQDTGNTAIITVQVAGELPQTPPDGEIFGVGVDLTLPSGAEVQVFTTGNVDGWIGYFQTSDGVFDLPGDLRVTGATVAFEVTWATLENAASGTFSAFLDWSRDRPVVNEVGEDHAPDDGAVPFQR